MLTNRHFKIGSLLVAICVGAVAFACVASYRAPIYLRYGNGIGEAWCVFDRGLVQVELNHGQHGADGLVFNDFSKLEHWGWHELQELRPGWRARVGLSTWSYYLGADSGIVGKPVHGRVIFFPLAPAGAAAVVLFIVLAATKSRRRIHASAATA